MASMGAAGQTNSNPGPVRSWPTNSYWTVLERDPAIYDTPFRITLFNPQNGEDSERVWSQTKSMLFYGLGVAGFLALLPAESTGWEDDGEDLHEKWIENVKAGPVWDRDNFIYNYVGHTYVGGVYYQVARKSGYRQWDSMIYSFLMSTFYWEYGVEAFAETPSIQDLVVTPVLGWVYGEWAYQTELQIREDAGRVLGSKILGGVSLFFLDPIDSIGQGVNNLTGHRLVKSGYGYFSYTAEPAVDATDHTVYLNIKFPIGGSSETEPREPVRVEHRDDPVDTGTVGISLGKGYAMLDNNWGIDDDLYTKVTLGLYFTSRISTRLSYAWGDFMDQASNPVRYENYSLDTQYYFFANRKLRPYLSAGFGEQMWQESLDQKYFQVNGGLGLHYQLHRKWVLQADWLNYVNTSEGTYDQTVNAALIFRFGQGERND